MLLIQGRELWVFVFWTLFLDITKMFHPLDLEIKNGKHYLNLNHILQQINMLHIWFQFYIIGIKGERKEGGKAKKEKEEKEEKKERGRKGKGKGQVDQTQQR